MNGLPFELAVFNSDMLNDENHIYLDYNYVTYGFGLIKWPIKENLVDSVNSALKELNNYGHFPHVLFVPFKAYHDEVSKQKTEDVLLGLFFKT